MTQQPVSIAVEEQGQEAPKVEVRDAEEMEIEMIPGTEKGENEQLQSQPTEEGQSDWRDVKLPKSNSSKGK